MRPIILLLLTALISTDATCPARLLGEEGFEICAFDKSGNALTSVLSLAANNLWAVQKALCDGQCFCRQDAGCSPPQIVCADPNAFNNTLSFIAKSLFGNPRQSLSNFISNIVYTGINWKLHCYCPNEVQGDPCPRVENPQACLLPETKDIPRDDSICSHSKLLSGSLKLTPEEA